MFDTFSRTWELTKQSFKVLGADKQMMVFPVLSAIAAIVVTVSFAIPVIAAGMLSNGRQPITNAEYGVIFVFYFVNYFVIVFFNSALVYCASVGLSGGHATVKDGLNAAWNSIGRIFMWALVAATVGMILRILEDRLGKLGKIVVWLLGMAWTLMTYFIVPVLVFETNLGMAESVKRSGSVLRDTWGEEVVSGFSFGLIWLVAILPGVALIVGGMMVHPLLGVAVGVLYFLMVAVVGSTVKTIFTVALYRYATQGQVPAGFSPALIEGAFLSKGKRFATTA